MSTWTTQSLERDRNYIVLKHTLRGVNYSIQGVKFRSGYAVVEKNSKVYFALKKIPVLRNALEYPLDHLQNLPFITRTQDVDTIFGRDVYIKYLAAIANSVQEVQEQIVEEKLHIHTEVQNKCRFSLENGEMCKRAAAEYSPSSYCEIHVLQDPKLAEHGFEVPPYMSKNQRKELRRKIKDKLGKK